MLNKEYVRWKLYIVQPATKEKILKLKDGSLLLQLLLEGSQQWHRTLMLSGMALLHSFKQAIDYCSGDGALEVASQCL